MVQLRDTRKPLIIDDQFVTVEISFGAAKVVNEFMRLHVAELDADLERFGLTMSEIAVPTYSRLVYADEAG